MKQYIVDAFAENVFEGNPAAICVMDEWISDDLMLNITKENNLSETAFTVKEGSSYRLRWFTPGGEIDLCGHATLAAAFVLMNYIEEGLTEVSFQTLSGELIVSKKEDLYVMDFPSYHLQKTDDIELVKEVIGFTPLETWMDRDLICVLENEEQVQTVEVNLEKAKELPGLLLHVTAKSNPYDCVSRTFAPKLNVTEDPVCGSGHCHLVPLWSKKLGKQNIIARQASERGGTLYCQLKEDRVELAGKAVLYAISDLYI